jgi:predicted anti-sigma-YlaC factor YlaD
MALTSERLEEALAHVAQCEDCRRWLAEMSEE